MDAILTIDISEIQLSVTTPAVSTQQAARNQIVPLQLSVTIIPPTVVASQNITVPVDTASVLITPADVAIDTFTYRKPSPTLRFQRSAWQARLGSRMDNIKRKLNDNAVLLAAHPTDMVRIRTKRDERTKDILTRTIESVEVMPIVLPTLKDVPMRRLYQEDGDYALSLQTLSSTPLVLYAPLQASLKREDLLFRLIHDDQVDNPYVMVLQIKDELATISYSTLLQVKYNAAFYDEILPQKVVQYLREAVTKREMLTW